MNAQSENDSTMLNSQIKLKGLKKRNKSSTRLSLCRKKQRSSNTMNVQVNVESQEVLGNQKLQDNTVASVPTSPPRFNALLEAYSDLMLPSAITSLANVTAPSVSSISTEETSIVAIDVSDLSSDKESSSASFNQAQRRAAIACPFIHVFDQIPPPVICGKIPRVESNTHFVSHPKIML